MDAIEHTLTMVPLDSCDKKILIARRDRYIGPVTLIAKIRSHNAFVMSAVLAACAMRVSNDICEKQTLDGWCVVTYTFCP